MLQQGLQTAALKQPLPSLRLPSCQEEPCQYPAGRAPGPRFPAKLQVRTAPAKAQRPPGLVARHRADEKTRQPHAVQEYPEVLTSQ